MNEEIPLSITIKAISGTGTVNVIDTDKSNIKIFNKCGVQELPLEPITANLLGTSPPSTSKPQCSDEKDNDGDGLVDIADPGCHTDNDASNQESYDPSRDSEVYLSTLPETTNLNFFDMKNFAIACLIIFLCYLIFKKRI